VGGLNLGAALAAVAAAASLRPTDQVAGPDIDLDAAVAATRPEGLSPFGYAVGATDGQPAEPLSIEVPECGHASNIQHPRLSDIEGETVGAFIAKDDIPSGTVLAYTRGQAVPADVVKEHGLEDYVVGENTKEAREIKAEVTGRPASDFETSSSTATATGRGAAKSSTNQEG
jgi:hypothetical protein